MSGQGSGGNVIAAVCSFFIPGLGQLVQGRIMAALLFFIVCAVNYGLAAMVIFIFLWPVAVIFHIWSIISAARFKG